MIKCWHWNLDSVKGLKMFQILENLAKKAFFGKNVQILDPMVGGVKHFFLAKLIILSDLLCQSTTKNGWEQNILKKYPPYLKTA